MTEIEQWLEDTRKRLVGKKYVFEYVHSLDKPDEENVTKIRAADSIEVIQIKQRDDGPWVTVHIIQGPGIPRPQSFKYSDFDAFFGHLFK